MREKPVLLVILVLAMGLLAAAPAAPSLQSSQASHWKPASASNTQSRLTVYRTVPQDLTADDALNLASSFFDMEGTPGEYQGTFYLTFGSHSFELNNVSGGMYYADNARLLNISLHSSLPTYAEAKVIADGFLDVHSLLPTEGAFAGWGSANATGYQVETHETTSRLLDIRVNYNFTLGGYPVDGPGAQITVIIGDGGAIIGLDYVWRELAFYDVFPTISLGDARVLLDWALHEIDVYNIVSEDLVYYTEPGFVEQDFVYPMYKFVITSTRADEEYTFIHYIPAVEFPPLVQIISPAYGASFVQGSPITFNATVSFGTAPFTTLWTYVYGSDTTYIAGQSASSNIFITNNLPIMSRDGGTTAYMVTLTVTDANGLVSQDSVLVTITPGGGIPGIGIEIVAILVIGFMGSAALLSRRKKLKGVTLLIMALITASFLLLPASSVQLDGAHQAKLAALARRIGQKTAADDGIKEVGVEWLGAKDALPYSKNNTGGFYSWMGSHGYNKEFYWGNYQAWQEDFKHEPFGGTDTFWVDAVDLVYFQGHGNPNGFFFNSQKDSTFMSCFQSRWGDGDLEWMVLDSCDILAWDWGPPIPGDNVFERWGQALQGVHMILSFSTIGINNQERGPFFAFQLTGFILQSPKTVKDAWFRAVQATENDLHYAAILYASTAEDPWNPPQDDPSNDYAHGFGYVSSDPTPARWWVWLTVQA